MLYSLIAARECKLLQAYGRLPEHFAVRVYHTRLIKLFFRKRAPVLINADGWVLVRFHIDDKTLLYCHDAFHFALVVSIA